MYAGEWDATWLSRQDGLQLLDAYIGAADTKPMPQELANCFPYLSREFDLLKNARVLTGPGAIAFNVILRV